jgi:hypothetical protein
MEEAFVTELDCGRNNRNKHKKGGGSMTSNHLGNKRVCPKCDAKFYDFGVVAPITCPKCSHKWTDGAKKKAAPAAKKEAKVPPKVVRKPARDEDDLMGLAGDLPDVEDGEAIEELEPMEDDGVELTSLQEVEEHEEAEESDPNSDDAEDDMFTELAGDNKIVDDFDEEEEDDEDDEEDDGDAEEDDEDDDDHGRKKRRR